MNYIPIINESTDDYIKVRDYLIEFLEELKERNRAKLQIKNQQNNINTKKPIQIEVKVINEEKPKEKVIIRNSPPPLPSIKVKSKPPLPPKGDSFKMRPKKKRNFKFMRYIPETKLDFFEDITLRKIENEYNSFQESTQLDYRSPTKRRSLIVENKNYDTHDKDTMSRSLQELLNAEFVPKSQIKYDFYNDFCQRLKQNDPYYDSRLASNYPNLNIIH